MWYNFLNKGKFRYYLYLKRLHQFINRPSSVTCKNTKMRFFTNTLADKIQIIFSLDSSYSSVHNFKFIFDLPSHTLFQTQINFKLWLYLYVYFFSDLLFSRHLIFPFCSQNGGHKISRYLRIHISSWHLRYRNRSKD